jgi:ribonuclease HII
MNTSTKAVIAGVDEVGRGPLAGPVVAVAVILPQAHNLIGIDDSKKLTANDRERLATEINQQAVSVCIAQASVAEIDALNILWASMLAMQRAVLGLTVTPTLVRVDGNRAPKLPYPTETINRGDQLDTTIAAASIVAKVHRDAIMVALHGQHPHYGWDRNKGYPTRNHKQALMDNGISQHHRRSFAPVRQALAVNQILRSEVSL